ncbi:hypothetical protein SLEP1_g2421 [Rubroshorea leprosula]|uniref:Uncharacterized protein n=1 Tax=Rubroshorea leprosula TaxID=152421 RepID=A0AAV5HSZ5_9ROSI|nr:hypothetical protein SLEP1_g2421 [Rubroshorea leprosula]
MDHIVVNHTTLSHPLELMLVEIFDICNYEGFGVASGIMTT